MLRCPYTVMIPVEITVTFIGQGTSASQKLHFHTEDNCLDPQFLHCTIAVELLPLFPLDKILRLRADPFNFYEQSPV